MAILYVNQNAAGSNNGSSWGNAYTDLQTAIADASSGDEIWVAKGTYKPGISREDSFTLKNRVEIYGGFAGIETSREQRDFENNETILSGEIGDTSDNSDNSYHVVLSSNTTPNTVLDGFTITGGNANNRSPNNNGGGIHNSNGNPTFTNLLIKDNSATSRGGGIYNVNSNSSFTNITFSKNSASSSSSRGGGIYNLSSSSIFTDVNFSENSAFNGAGIYNENSDTNLTNVDLKNNSASSRGGGIYNYDSSPSLTNVNFEDNISDNGGGIFNYRDSDPRITNTTFRYNLAGGSSGGGGAIYNDGVNSSSNSSNPVITNTLFQGNSSSSDGGAIYNDTYSHTTINNSTFTENQSANGGAIFSVETTSDSARPSITINNSILWKNEATISEDEIGGTTATVSYSIVRGGYPGTGNKQDDPLFVDPDNDNFRLQPNSPAIDMGNNDSLPADVDDLDDDADTSEKIPFDLDGNIRIVNATVDMGAYEGGGSGNTISISDVSLLEGDSGSQNFGFTVNLSRSSSETVTVDYSTADGTAIAGIDYTATSRTLTFNPGETSKTINVPVIGDTVDESNETFFVNLSNPINASISDSQGTGTIIDDDGTPPIQPIVTISDVSALEGDSGTKSFTFTVNLSTSSTETIALDFLTADGSATDGIDYIGTSGTLTFNPGETSKTIDVSVIGDTTVESDETFLVNLSNATNAIISDAQGIGRILNDDSGTRVDVDNELSLLVDISESIDNQEYKTQIEGYIAAFNNENLFNNFIDQGIEGQVAVNLVVWAGEDQIQEVVGWTLIDSVETSKDFAIAIGDALLPENGGSRPFDGATAPGDAIDFAVPLFSSNVYDGRRWKIDLSADGKQNDGINSATARDEALAEGVHSINAIVVSDDESVVDFYRDNVIGGSGAFVSQINDFTEFEEGIYEKLTTELTPLPRLFISDVSLQEGDNGTTDFVFDVTLSETSTEAISPSGMREAIAVDFTTGDGTAVAGKDYTATNGTLNFAAGETSKQVTVSVTGENRLEIDENFFVNLSNATNAEISDNQGEGTILNDDEIQLDDNCVDENSPEGTVVGLLSATDPGDTDPFTFSLLNDAGGRFQIVGKELQVANGDLLDFETNNSHTVTIRATDSNGNNFDQTFIIEIKDVNEGPSFGAVFTIEENSPEGTFVTQLSATDPEGDTLEYAITSGNIDPDGDGTAAFAIDSATGRITVADSGDLDFETTPTFNLNLNVTDEDDLSDNARITINLADVDESVPVDIQNAIFSLPENSEEETVVGIVPAETNSNEAVLPIIENEPPIADDAIFDLQENSNDETVIGIVTATDSETEILNFGITSGNLSPDKDNKQAFAIDSLTGAIIVNDSDDIDFETTPNFNLEVLATDAGGLSDTADITINLIDVPSVEFAQDSNQNGFFALKVGESKNLKFTVDNVGTDNINEVGLFIVDDQNGNINGIAPDFPDYLQAALERSQVIVSAISDIPSGFNLGDIKRILEVDSNTRFGFYMISNASTDEVLSELQSTGTTNSPVFFSNSSNMRVADLDAYSFTLEWSEQEFSNNLTDIALNVELSSQPPALGTKLQRETQQELIDLSDVTDPVSVEVQVYREAAQDNVIGFYQITDINGGIDIDGDGVADINPGDAGYKQAALTNRITGLDLLQTENEQTTTFNGTFDGDSILAPFMIVDGTLDEAINDNAEVYFSFLGANSDGVDHIRLLGDNIFGFEDLVSGGDFDFNDVIVEIDILAG
ncbi:MAG: Calx-beta domain-containing protein [Cyanobacteria bacterium P01_D01_bin.50]